MKPDIMGSMTDRFRYLHKTAAVCSFLMTLYLVGCQQPVIMPDFGKIQDTEKKKIRFFSFMAPAINAENNRILRTREKLLRLHEIHLKNSRMSRINTQWIKKLASAYDADGGNSEIPWQELLRRIDIVPLELALVQAAKESGWGTSRYAREGYNMFGEYCYGTGCGIVPEERDPGARHEVAKFPSLTESVSSYIHNLNTHDAYVEFRMLRFRLRMEAKALDGYALAETLLPYSERRAAYTVEIQDMIRENRHLMNL